MSQKTKTLSQSNTSNPGEQLEVTSVDSYVAPTFIEEISTATSQVVAYFVPPDVGVLSPQVSTIPIFSREL